MEDFDEDDEQEQDDDMEEDEEEGDEEEEDEEEENYGLPFRCSNPYSDIAREDEEDVSEEEDGEEEDGEEADEDSEGEEEEEMDDDALGGEAARGAGYDQFGHVLASGSPATQARRMELAGNLTFPLLLMSPGMQHQSSCVLLWLAAACFAYIRVAV